MVHDTGRGGENNVSELTGWQKLDNPLLELTEADVVSWRDDTGLVETISKSVLFKVYWQCESLPAVQLNDNLARSVVINFLELADVTLKQCQYVAKD